jgi:hypothetical protein
LNCHGVDGLASAGVGKVVKVKPVTEAEVRDKTEAEMTQATRNGMGNMGP